jgi:hypothetical protein
MYWQQLSNGMQGNIWQELSRPEAQVSHDDGSEAQDRLVEA